MTIQNSHEDTKLKIPKADGNLVRQSDRIRNIPPARMEALNAFLATEVPRLISERLAETERVKRWRKTLEGKNPDAPVTQGVSNVSVPLMMWVRSSVHKRLFRGVFGQTPFLAFEEMNVNADDETTADTKTTLKALGKLMQHLIVDPRAFNGKAAIRRVTADATDTGIGAWQVRETPDVLIQVPPAESANPADVDSAADVETDVQFGTIRWEPIAYEWLIAYDGYGNDANAMPLVGHRFKKPWHSIKLWAHATHDHYDPESIKHVTAYYDVDSRRDLPIDLREHWVSELYLDFDITGRGLLAPIVVDWHVESQRTMRVAWNRYGGHRPIILTQFDTPANPHALQGQGVCEKLESPQAEANALHNIAIEAVKRSINIVVTRTESTIAEELDGKAVIPTEVYTTENIKEDIAVFELGQPQIAQTLLGFEAANQQYAKNLMGVGEASLGDVTAGKRVPAQLGVPIMKEGQIFIEDPLASIADGMVEAIYLSLEAMRRKPPLQAMRNLLTPDEITLLQSTVFGGLDSTKRSSLRSSLRITVKARDVAAAQQQRKNELLMLSQVLTTYNDRLSQTIQLVSSEQVPDATKKALFHLAEKMGGSIEAFVRTMDSIDDPSEVLADIPTLQKLLGVSNAATATQDQSTGTTELSIVPSADADIESRGGGVL